MKLIPAEWREEPAAVINVSFIGQNGKKVVKAHDIYASAAMVTNNATYESDFMPSVNSFANTLGVTYGTLSSANVDVSVTFTNPFASVNANVGEWGNGDVFELASLSAYLDTDKVATLTVPAPVQTIFLATDGPDRDRINTASATAGLLFDLMEAIGGLPDEATIPSAWGISDGERVDGTLGTNGLRIGKRIVRRYTPKAIG